MTVKPNKKEQLIQGAWRATYFARYMWAVAILGALFAVLDLVAAVTGENKGIFYALAAQASLLSVFSIIAAVLGRSGKMRVGVAFWTIATSLYMLTTPLLATGLLPFVMAGVVVIIVTAAIFFSLQSVPKITPLLALLVIAATLLEQWTPPWLRINEMVESPFIPIALNLVTFVFTAFLINLMGQTMSQAVESAQEYANLIEQSQATLVGRAADLENLTQSLARRSEEQDILNQELEFAAQKAERRAVQLAASAQVARAVSQVRDQDQLLSQVAQLISSAFGYYHVGIFILDEIGRFAVLRAANSQGGRAMLARGHKLEVGKRGIVGYVTSAGEPRIALDVGDDAAHFNNPDLPNTRSEMALPLKVGNEIIGALDVQSVQESAFVEEDIAVLGTLADQIAIAIQNARLFEQTQSALQEAEEIQKRYVRQQWADMLPTLSTSSYEYHVSGLTDMRDASLPEIEQAIRQGQTVTLKKEEGAPTQEAAIAVPIKLRDEIVGVIDLHETDIAREWSDEDIAFVTAIADQAALALENARLFTQTQQRAQREQLIAQIAAKMRAAPDVEGVLRTAVQEIRRALGASHGIVRLAIEDEEKR